MSAQLQLGTDGAVGFANNTSLAASNRIYVTFAILGSTLKSVLTLTGTQRSLIAGVGNSDLSVLKVGLFGTGGVGTPGFLIRDQSANDWNLLLDGVDLTTLSDSLYYECALIVNDAGVAGNSLWFGLYAPGGIFTGPGFIGDFANASTPSVGTSAGSGCLWLGNAGGSAFPTPVGQVRTFDWAKAGNDNTTSYLTANLEEGSGTAVSPGGTITGTYTWIGSGGGGGGALGGDGDQGTPSYLLTPRALQWNTTVFA